MITVLCQTSEKKVVAGCGVDECTTTLTAATLPLVPALTLFPLPGVVTVVFAAPFLEPVLLRLVVPPWDTLAVPLDDDETDDAEEDEDDPEDDTEDEEPDRDMFPSSSSSPSSLLPLFRQAFWISLAQ